MLKNTLLKSHGRLCVAMYRGLVLNSALQFASLELMRIRDGMKDYLCPELVVSRLHRGVFEADFELPS